MTEHEFITEVQKLSAENRDSEKSFHLEFSEFNPRSLLTFKTDNFESAKSVLKKIASENYNEDNFKMPKNISNEKEVYIHFVITESESE